MALDAPPKGLRASPSPAAPQYSANPNLLPERRLEPRSDDIDLAIRIDLAQQPLGPVVLHQRLREIIQRVPRSSAQLAAVPEMPEGVVKHSGEEILALIEAVGVTEPPPPLPRRERPDPAFTAMVKRLADLTQRIATDLGIASEVLATRRDLEQLARGEQTAAVLNGWRREIVGAKLLAVV